MAFNHLLFILTTSLTIILHFINGVTFIKIAILNIEIPKVIYCNMQIGSWFEQYTLPWKAFGDHIYAIFFVKFTISRHFSD